ncbi:flagellar brake protein [Roseateles koreensis]|uniref:Flagellar brake protein YcgR n=1 Tax=Roseateles koreensis TaxID=2987526 RepID=A0ABT5KU59_9BURK|nr:flagellar brake protein [Roseateles koreensis]MDC8786372.1 flagellar brake protein [Roseateles koreensis]
MSSSLSSLNFSPAAPNQVAAGDFRIQSPAEVLAWLQSLLQQQSRITLSGANGATMPTRLSAIDGQRGAIGFDADPRSPDLQALLSADEVTAVVYLDQIKIQFEVDGLMRLNSPDLSNGLVLQAQLPSQLYRFQRRQTFRVQPNTRTPQVRLTHPQHPELQLRLRIIDLSLGGLALLLPADQPDMAPGSLIPGVQVELDRETRFETGLRLQNARPSLEGGQHVGLTFSSIDNEAERNLQRYIDQTQKLGRLLRKSAPA